MIKKILITSAFSGTSGGDYHIKKMEELWEKEGIIVEHYYDKPISFKTQNLIFPMAFFKDFKDQFQKVKEFDCIIASSPYLPDFLPVFVLNRKYRKPTIVYFHHLPPHFYWKPFKRGMLSSIFNSIFINISLIISKILGMTIFLDQPQAYSLGSAIVMKDEDAIDSEFKEALAKVDKENKFDILYLGRFSSTKGVLDLVNAVAKIKNSIPSIQVCMAGYAEDQKYLEKVRMKINKLGLSNNFQIYLNVDLHMKVKLLKSTKLFVFPSYVEGWALSVMEAAYAGVPIIAYNLPAYSYLGGNYYPVTPGKIDELSYTIKKALLNYKIAEEIAKKAREKVSTYSYEKIAMDQLNYFNSLK